MAGKSNGHNMETDWARAPPPPGTTWERIGKAFYDPDEGTVLGRTPKRWAIVVVFYGIFYAVLAAMFTACMAGLFYNIDEHRPYYTLTSSLIGDNPGVSFRPLNENDPELKYRPDNVTESHPYIMQLEDFFQPYKGDPWYSLQTECVSENMFGFPMTPCFFIKINKIFDWKPDYYDVSELPTDMPDDLKEYIKSKPPNEQKQVWVSCWNEKSNNTATFTYPWGQGMPSSYFPYVNSPAYRAPLVAVKISNIEKNNIVRCRAWAKNIVYNKSIKEPRGYGRILLSIDMD